jgi:hypothetical protein
MTVGCYAWRLGKAMTDDAKQGGGIVYRLGWVLYWVCLALIAAWVLFVALFISVTWNAPSILVFGIPSAALYGLGRAFRYVLSGR